MPPGPPPGVPPSARAPMMMPKPLGVLSAKPQINKVKKFRLKLVRRKASNV